MKRIIKFIRTTYASLGAFLMFSVVKHSLLVVGLVTILFLTQSFSTNEAERRAREWVDVLRYGDQISEMSSSGQWKTRIKRELLLTPDDRTSFLAKLTSAQAALTVR